MIDDLISKLREGGNGNFSVHPLGDYGVCDEAAEALILLRDALARISALTPFRANARTAAELHLTIKAIAEAALTPTKIEKAE